MFTAKLFAISTAAGTHCSPLGLAPARLSGQETLVNFHTALIFRQVPFVVGLEEDLYIGLIRTQGVNEGLENRNSIFRPVSFVAQCSEPMCGAIPEVKPAVRIKTLVLSIDQTSAGGVHHAGKLTSCSRLGFEPVDPYEIVELLFAHGRGLSLSQKQKSSAIHLLC